MNTPTKLIPHSPAHLAFRQDLLGALSRHTNLDADELLSVTAYFLGQVVACQDQTIMTPKMAMDIVARNIEAGNQDAIQNYGHFGRTSTEVK